MGAANQAIDAQASEFASKITQIARLFGGPQTTDFVSDVMKGRGGWLIEIHNHQDGFTLKADEDETFLVQATWTCTSDGAGRWLKVERSSFGVYFCSRPTHPLFRYDFDAKYSARLPKAHIHFHVDHPDMNPSQPMKDTEESLTHLGGGSRRARSRRAKHGLNVSDLHFPVGGTRFRPALEDVLLMMVEEYGVEPWEVTPQQAVTELRRTILAWRKSQVKAVVRDMPSLAIEYFESQGFKLVPDPEGPDPGLRLEDVFRDNPDKLIDP